MEKRISDKKRVFFFALKKKQVLMCFLGSDTD